jgi:DnaK suppressor protein
MSKFDVLRKKMENRRTELHDRLERIKKDLAKPRDKDWEEQAQERENDDVLNQLKVDIDNELRDINKALDRMKNHQYGICVSCAADIPMARLEIKPEVGLCVKCAA